MFSGTRSKVLYLILAASANLHCTVFAARILIIHPIYSGSHVWTLRNLAEQALLPRGHSVHIVHWKDAQLPSSFHIINNRNLTISTMAMDNSDGKYFTLTTEKEASFVVPMNKLFHSDVTVTSLLSDSTWFQFFPFLAAHCDNLLANQTLITTLQSSKFDLAIVDLVWNDCSIALARHLQIPRLVGFWGMFPTGLLPPLTGQSVSYLQTLHYEANSWTSKISNSVLSILSEIIQMVYHSYIQNSVTEHLSHSLPQMGPVSGLLADLDAVIVNVDPVLDIQRQEPFPQNYRYVGGLHFNEHSSQSLQNTVAEQWLDECQGCVAIIFSMGLSIDLSKLPQYIFQAFYHTFSKRNQRVLMQIRNSSNFAAETLANPAANVKLVDWLPQQNVLGHRNTRLFISHCGLQGVMEAIYNGVPLICLPIINDGVPILHQLHKLGVAIGLDKYTLTEADVDEAIDKVLSNVTFRDRAMELSKMMKSRKPSPKERVVEYLESFKAQDTSCECQSESSVFQSVSWH